MARLKSFTWEIGAILLVAKYAAEIAAADAPVVGSTKASDAARETASALLYTAQGMAEDDYPRLTHVPVARRHVERAWGQVGATP